MKKLNHYYYCLDKNNNLRIFECIGNSKLVKIGLEHKGYKIIEDEEEIKRLLELDAAK